LALGTETSDRCPLFNLGDFYMKKTLVALAALAATGAFAQVSITGEFAYGFSTGTDAAGAEAGGFGVDTSQLWFKANEDLGGGYKAGVSMSLAGADRSGESTATAGNGNVTGRDAQLDLTTPFGLLSMGTKKNADWLNSITPDGTWYSLDGNNRAGRTRRDQVTFAVPYGAFAFAFTAQEAAENMGLGAGSEGAAGTTKQRLTGYVAKYSAGALKAEGQYLVYDSNAGGAKNTLRLGGSYDLGVANLGLATQITDYDFTGGAALSKQTDTQIGASIPMGALTIGAVYALNKVDDGAAQGTRLGYSLQAQYNLSKQTYVIVSTKRWEAAVNATASTQSNLLVVKDF